MGGDWSPGWLSESGGVAESVSIKAGMQTEPLRCLVTQTLILKLSRLVLVAML